MARITKYQLKTLKSIESGDVMLRGPFDRYWWQSSDKLCSVVGRRLRSKGFIRAVYLNSVRDKIELTNAGRAILEMNEEAL